MGYLSDRQFKLMFRISRKSFDELLELVKEAIEPDRFQKYKVEKQYGSYISAKTRLAASL